MKTALTLLVSVVLGCCAGWVCYSIGFRDGELSANQIRDQGELGSSQGHALAHVSEWVNRPSQERGFERMPEEWVRPRNYNVHTELFGWRIKGTLTFADDLPEIRWHEYRWTGRNQWLNPDLADCESMTFLTAEMMRLQFGEPIQPGDVPADAWRLAEK